MTFMIKKYNDLNLFTDISLDSFTILINIFTELVEMYSGIDFKRYSNAVEFAQN